MTADVADGWGESLPAPPDDPDAKPKSIAEAVALGAQFPAMLPCWWCTAIATHVAWTRQSSLERACGCLDACNGHPSCGSHTAHDRVMCFRLGWPLDWALVWTALNDVQSTVVFPEGRP